MIKIVYFDEPSATDYIIIKDGGAKITSEEQLDEASASAQNKTRLTVGGSFSWWPFAKIEAENSTDIGLEGVKKALTKNIITNVLLTDFLKKAKEDNKYIQEFKNLKVYTYKTSFAFLGMFMPYLKIVKESQFPEELPFDITKLAEALQEGKKYYEMIAEEQYKNDIKKYILRFNIDAFRNNYSISDIPKMNLKYYAIKVGDTYEERLNIEEEFKSVYEEENISSLLDMDNKNDNNNTLLPVYDVILAGVSQ